jgi:hypothetical protein
MRALGGLAIVAIAVVLSPVPAKAQERLTHAAVGAVAGAVAAGPIGFLGGGLIGYVAGPQIGCDLGVERCHRYARYRRSGRGAPDASPRTSDRSDHFRGPGDLGKREDHGNY